MPMLANNPSVIPSPLTKEAGQAVWRDCAESGCVRCVGHMQRILACKAAGVKARDPSAVRVTQMLMRHLRSEFHIQNVKGGKVGKQFYICEEFVEELQKQKDRIPQGTLQKPIVRLTCRAEVKPTTMVRSVQVLSTVLVLVPPASRDIIRLEYDCGLESVLPDESHPATERAGKALEALQAQLLALGFDVRAGVIEPGERAP